ncbi:MAG: type II toxin-antitoxin system YafQ family toxin [Candidatus Altimarinota bacterium]
MKVETIHTSQHFRKQFTELPKSIKEKALKTEELFRANPFHPSLRLHKLKGKLEGLWSISLDRKHRIIFKSMEDSSILFISIGTHAIYED